MNGSIFSDFHTVGEAAYVYARAYPNRVRAIALMGPADVASRMPIYHAQEAEKSFRLLCESCRQDSLCNQSYPDLASELVQVVHRLREKSTMVKYIHPTTGDTTSLSIRADVFVESLRSASYAPGSASEVPWIVHQAYSGNFDPYLNMMIPTEFGRPPFLAEGLYLSITGAEDAPFISEDEANRLSAGTFLGNYRVAQQQRAATLWPQGIVPMNYFDTTALSVPTLIIQGGRDPVIGAGTAIRRYANGREVVIPQMGHVPWGLSNPSCIDSLLFSFFETANNSNLDTSCVLMMTPPPFKIAEDAEQE